MVRARVADSAGNKTKMYAVILRDGLPVPKAGTKFCHNRETRDNPKNVWTHVRPQFSVAFDIERGETVLV